MNPKLKLFIDWYFNEEREPRTQVEWCKENRVSPATMSKWVRGIKDNKISRPVDELTQFLEHCREIAFSSKGTSKDRELYSKLNGWLIEKREDKVKIEPNSGDYIRWGREILEQLRQDYRGGNEVCPICGRFQEVLSRPSLHSNESQASEDNQVGVVGLLT